MKKIITLILIGSSAASFVAVAAEAEESKIKIEMPTEEREIAREEDSRPDIGGQVRENEESRKHNEFLRFIDRHYNR